MDSDSPVVLVLKDHRARFNTTDHKKLPSIDFPFKEWFSVNLDNFSLYCGSITVWCPPRFNFRPLLISLHMLPLSLIFSRNIAYLILPGLAAQLGPLWSNVKDHVRGLGVIFKSLLLFSKQFNAVDKGSFYHLSSITKIEHFLFNKDLEIMIHSLIS